MSKLFPEDWKIKQIALQNLRARISQRAKELGVDFEDVQSENMVKPWKIIFEYARHTLCPSWDKNNDDKK